MDRDAIGEERRTLGPMMERRANKNSVLKVERFVAFLFERTGTRFRDDTANVTCSRYGYERCLQTVNAMAMDRII